jgi:hypothetical protein
MIRIILVISFSLNNAYCATGIKEKTMVVILLGVFWLSTFEMVIKAIADRKTERLLGVQIIGKKGVDKRIDVFATAITFGAKAGDLAGIINLIRENNYKCIFSRDAVIRDIFLIHYKIKREKGAMNGRKET